MKRSPWLEKVLHMWPVKILSVIGAVILFFITRLVDLGPRVISAPIRYMIASGYVISEQYPTRATITLRGERDKIYGVSEDDLQVIADFSSHETEGSFQTALRVIRLGTVADINPLEITPEPGTVTISLERSASKEVPVTVHLSGNPKTGTELVSYDLSPDRVRITGPRSRIPNVQGVDTDEIDLSSHGEDFTQKVRLRTSDSLVKINNVDSVELRVDIREAMRVGVFQDVPVAPVGLAAGLAVDTASLTKGSVKLQGFMNQLNLVENTQLRMLVDLSGIGAPGVYTVKVIPEIPPDLIVLSYEPKTLEVTVTAEGAVQGPVPSARTQ